jgi:hypothetical protein
MCSYPHSAGDPSYLQNSMPHPCKVHAKSMPDTMLRSHFGSSLFPQLQSWSTIVVGCVVHMWGGVCAVSCNIRTGVTPPPQQQQFSTSGGRGLTPCSNNLAPMGGGHPAPATTAASDGVGGVYPPPLQWQSRGDRG